MDKNSNHSWDARTYDKVSINVQLEWGRNLIENRRWVGNEIVLDAGAGSGNLTRILADKVPDGQVYAVDADANMVEYAKSNLPGYKNVQVIHSSMDKVNLPTKVDVIFSNAALHWVLNHDDVFSHFRRLLKSSNGRSGGGELLIECAGGNDNLAGTLPVIFRIMQYDQFKEYFVNWKQSWQYPKPDEAERLLQEAGFKNIKVKLSKRTTYFSDPQCFAIFVRTVIMKPFLGYISDSKKKDEFVEVFLNEHEERSDHQAGSLDFTLLNIFARK